MDGVVENISVEEFQAGKSRSQPVLLRTDEMVHESAPYGSMQMTQASPYPFLAEPALNGSKRRKCAGSHPVAHLTIPAKRVPSPNLSGVPAVEIRKILTPLRNESARAA